MARRTEQEVDRTLGFLNETDSLSVDPTFVDRVCSRTAGMPGGRGVRERGRFSSAMIILILLILNITAGLTMYEDRQSDKEQAISYESYESYASIMADEYLSGQDMGMTF